jgi:uncharacterized protein YgbK (DUF1537 family)
MAVLIGIVADDLTGAADAVAPFAQRGFQAGVGWELSHGVPRFRMGDAEALACDTETRDLRRQPESWITVPVRRATRRVAELGARVIYKKIDSTLRGHLRLELEAMRYELPDRLALVCPAFPANGRTVQNGVLCIDGMPWTSTDFAPPYHVDQPTVRAAFSMIHDPTAADLSGSVIRGGSDAVEADLDRLRAAGVQTVFCDAADDAHLNVLAQVILRRADTYLPVGSAGWVAALAAQTALPASPPPRRAVWQSGRLLVIVGSLHRASRRQLEALNARIGMPPILFEPGREEAKVVVLAAGDAIVARFRAGQRAVVVATPDAAVTDLDSYGWMLGSIARTTCVRALREGLPIEGLVLTGGRTAIQVCSQINDAIGLRVESETQPGVVTARLRTEPDPVTGLSFDGLPIITKAGGFGDESTLLRCIGLTP